MTKHLILSAIATLASATMAFSEGHASGDPEAGEKVFRQCKACHMIVDNDGNEIQKGGKTGPNLYGILGRTAGTYDGFRYSKDIQAVGEAGLAWTEAEFVTYVQDPTGYLRDYLDDNSARSKMTYRVRKEEDATDIWAYLVSVGPAPDS